jgi:hypothetical protein
MATALPATSAWAVDPAIHQPVAELVVRGRGGRRVAREAGNHISSTVKLLLDGGGPVDVVMEQPLQSLPVAALDRIEHVAYRWDLLSHDYSLASAFSTSRRAARRAGSCAASRPAKAAAISSTTSVPAGTEST